MPLDFKKVEDILVSKEGTMSEEVVNWKRGYEVMEKRHGEETLCRILLEGELIKSKSKLGQLADQMARLEDRQLDHQKEISAAIYVKERVEEMYRKLANDFEAMSRENRDLSVRNLESEFARCKAERQVESLDKQKKEFELRVTKLEQEYVLLVNQLSKETERGGSSQRDSPKVDRKIEHAIIAISDDDSYMEVATRNAAGRVPSNNVLNVTRNKKETESRTSEQVTRRNQGSSGSKTSRLPYFDSSSADTDSDYDYDDVSDNDG